MRQSLLALSTVAFIVTEVVAFPQMAVKQALQEAKRSGVKLPKREKPVKKAVGFDAAQQFVSTSGEHIWVSPSSTDQRGPCPGLNAAANHGYIPHSGVGTIGEIIQGVNEAFGMAVDLGTFLAAFGAVFDGNLLGYSIGGPTAQSQLPLNNLLGLLGSPQGLSGSHNKYESDASPTRGDLYLKGNDYTVQLDQFEQYYDALTPLENLGADQQYDGLVDFRISRFENSKQTNPYFFYSPFAGVLVSPAGWAFPPRMMSNKSAEFPEGNLDLETFKAFFAVTGEKGSFQYTVGHERIPDNFYKRAVGDEYTIAGFLVDVLDYAEQYPDFLDIGGNTGTAGSFALVDVGALTKGVFSTATLLEGNNLLCFTLQAAQAAIPDILGANSVVSGSVIAPVTNSINTILGSLACPQLQGLDNSQFNIFPGYTQCQGTSYGIKGCASY
jgi:hypothetical protein